MQLDVHLIAYTSVKIQVEIGESAVSNCYKVYGAKIFFVPFRIAISNKKL